jgi:hypothetical protein
MSVGVAIGMASCIILLAAYGRPSDDQGRRPVMDSVVAAFVVVFIFRLLAV